MLVLIDSANLQDIEELYNRYPYDGVTTNPTILMREHKNPFKQLKRIREILPNDSQLHAQLISADSKTMLEEAHFMLRELGDDLFVKVPVTVDGMRTISLLAKDGIRVTATAIYTAMQAFMAAKAGARYTAPYVNRLDNMGSDGVRVASTIHDMFRIHQMNADVLAASFKNTQQILELCKHGIGAVTAAPDVLRALILHDATFTAEENFTQDFFSLIKEVQGVDLRDKK